jgi:hypothetical protein
MSFTVYVLKSDISMKKKKQSEILRKENITRLFFTLYFEVHLRLYSETGEFRSTLNPGGCTLQGKWLIQMAGNIHMLKQTFQNLISTMT